MCFNSRYVHPLWCRRKTSSCLFLDCFLILIDHSNNQYCITHYFPSAEAFLKGTDVFLQWMLSGREYRANVECRGNVCLREETVTSIWRWPGAGRVGVRLTRDPFWLEPRFHRHSRYWPVEVTFFKSHFWLHNINECISHCVYLQNCFSFVILKRIRVLATWKSFVSKKRGGGGTIIILLMLLKCQDLFVSFWAFGQSVG